MKSITLINGPYNDYVIEDSGTVLIRMAVYDPAQVIGARVGDAIYEPNKERTLAFFNRNVWHGTLLGIYPA